MTNKTAANTNKTRMGIIDVPCCEEQQDMLDMIKYVKGLENFVRKCPTPMSIAIQGDWGTGKTSTINMLKRRLEADKSIKCIYFNTWQYSQFNMADDLYVSFVNALVRKCCTKLDMAKEIIGIVQKMGAKLLYNTVKDNIGLNVEEFFNMQGEKMENVENLKTKFAKMIEAEVKGNENGRIVVFIDDLDRLNPEVAVELLEVIKLFMDVEKCIFVLAIDYEVVVNGVRSKYGQNVSEVKCRSFFDKIIQLPFRLPVESYRLEGLIRKTVEDDILEDDIEALNDLVIELLGANPRAYKRLANSFFLIKSVNETIQKGSDQQLDNVLIFGSLCIQMCAPKFYQILMSVTDKNVFKEMCTIVSKEELDTFFLKQKLDLSMNEKEKKNVFRCLVSFNEFLNSVQKNHKNEKEIFIHLSGVLQMTVITSVETANEQKKRATSIKVNKIVVNGKEQTVETPTEAIVETYGKLLKDNEELIQLCCSKEERILTRDSDRAESFFRNKRKVYEKGDAKVYIGLSSSTNDKMRYTIRFCNLLKNYGREAHVIWKYNDVLVFDSDNQ